MSLDGYEILTKLGSGAFGVVYKARDKKDNKICVVKKVDMSSMSLKLRKHTMEEGRMLKDMNSPFIVKHFGTFMQKNTLNIVMEYCPKGDLSCFLKAQMGKPLKEDTIWKLSIQMMVGLRDLHVKKILHRDIKSLNVFLDEEYNVRIGDLGVAKALKNDFAHTIVGTPYYLSPEMCEEKPYNEKTDIWALGCLIYELCTGKHPFEATNQAALALKIVMGKYQNIPKHYSQNLSWVVKSCLSVDYKRRPTAAYLLTKESIVEWANKLGIPLQVASIKKQGQDLSSENKKQSSEQKNEVVVNKYEKPKVAISESDVPIFKKKPPLQSHKSAQQQKINKRAGQKNYKVPLPGSNKNLAVDKPVPPPGSNKNLAVDKPVPPPGSNKNLAVDKPVPPPGNSKNLAVDKPVSIAKKMSAAKKQELRGKEKAMKLSQQWIEPSSTESNNQIIEKDAHKSPVCQLQSGVVSKNRFNVTTNRFVPEKVRQRNEFDLQDQLGIQDKFQISDSDDSDDNPDPREQTGTKPCQQILRQAQSAIDDDQLAEEFGISPAKREGLESIKLQNKVRTINWDIDEETRTMVICAQQESQMRKISGIKQLPTVKTPSYLERESFEEMEVDHEGNKSTEVSRGATTDEIKEEIEENQPYISSDENSDEETTKQGYLESQDQVAELLIEDYTQKQQNYTEKLKQNLKRQSQIERMKKYYESELLKIICEEEYIKMKQQLLDCNEQEDDDAINQVVKKWKDSIQCINLFYRIIHFEMELKRCSENIRNIHERLEEVRKNINL